jgi:hypothetical protein
MIQKPLFILRQSPDWHSLSADFRKGLKVDPARFRPPVHIPGFPGHIVQLVDQWNDTMGVDFFSCRSRLKEMCEDSIAQIPGARRTTYLELENFGPDIENYVAFYHDDDDWFAPDAAQILEEVLPENYDVCVFPLVRIAGQTSTLIRQGGRPDVMVGLPRPFSHRYQSNNYGVNGRRYSGQALLGMKDHVIGSEYANTNGLRDVYINRIISATAKTPCSAQAVAGMFREPGRAREHVQNYVTALKAVEVPSSLPWIESRLNGLIALFSEALEMRAGFVAAKPPAPAKPAVQAGAPIGGNVATLAGRTLQRHTGVQYIQFLKFLAERQTPSSYLEIGTRNGESAAQVDYDMICIDPNFALTFNVIKRRGRSLMFQTTSDAFFADNDVRQFFPQGLDMAFLDGMHLYEFLLRDFMNTEKYCHANSVVLMHDCLPFKKEITNRVQTPGAWTGDVWKVIAILKKYRPDVNVTFFECPPTGLVSCSNLDPTSTVLSDSYDQIVAEFANAELPDDLFSLYPRIDTKSLVAAPEGLRKILPPPGNGLRSAPRSAVAAG